MYSLINQAHQKLILQFINTIMTLEITEIVDSFYKIIECIHTDIPQKKRISYGRYTIIKNLGTYIYPILEREHIDIPSFTLKIFNNSEYDQFVRSLCVQLLSIYGVENGELDKVLGIFENAASDENWIVRECSSGFIRILIRKYPDTLHIWYLKMVKSKDAMQRRFASESLRPVADNNWFKNNPEYAFSIIKNLYEESAEYPRTSVGNSLSDWMRIDEEKTLHIVKKLVKSGNKNSYWIAYRACRNLIKKKPILVMDILKIDQYTYKDRKFYRKDCE